jgi:IclR family KDG regulon transcriptional repressor
MGGVVKPVQNAIRMLHLLGEQGTMGVTQIASRLDLSKSSVHDILCTLLSDGLVEKDTERSVYRLGIRLFELGNLARASLELRRLALPHLKALNEALDETVHLTVVDEDEVLYVECYESSKRLRTYSVIGVRAPLFCTAVGKAILAFQQAEQIERVIREQGLRRFTAQTITDAARLKKELRAIAARGYAVDNMEHEEGVRCVGAPIRDHDGRVFASISVSGPSQRMLPERDEDTARLLVSRTQDISRRLGYRGQ